MQPDKHQQIKEIFNSALEYSGEERERFLVEVCGPDRDLRREVDVLLHSYQSDFLESPVYKLDSANISIGQKINHYVILEELGHGGMGEVFLAEDTRLYRRVAIKFLKSGHDRSEIQLKREARAAALLNHANICTIFEIGEDNSRSFIVMEYVEGATLDKLIKQGNLSIQQSVAIALAIADALAEAHTRGVIHRDIKPSNVIVTPKGQVKVLDFGLAKKTLFSENESVQSLFSHPGCVAGTVAYMSPEQARGREIDARSDIWSLGVVLYEMLTGHPPFRGETKSDVIAAILRGNLRPLDEFRQDLPAETQPIINKALEKDRVQRYQTLRKFSADLLNLEYNPENRGGADETKAVSRQTGQLPAHFSDESSESKTDPEMNPVTNEISSRSRVEYVFTKIKNYRVFTLATIILAVLGGITVWQTVSWIPSKPVPFSAASRSDLQISSLFNIKRKPGGSISSPGFSPDGNLLVFSLAGEGKSKIYIKQLNGSELVEITDGKWFETNPIWSPDGQRIAFISNRDGQKGIWSVSYFGGKPTLLKTVDLPQDAQLKKWGRDERTIYYEAKGNLYTFDLSDGTTSEIVLADKAPSYNYSISPDEKMISYVVVENEKEQIWIQSRQDGQREKILHGDHHNWYPTWFPDNQRLAYSSDQNGNFEIYVFDLQSLQSTQITFGDSDAEIPAVSPDGLKIAFISVKDDANIYAYNLPENKESAQTENIGLQLFPDISPDGRQIAFQATTVTAKIFASPLKIKTLDAVGEPTTIADNGGVPRWSPDGKNLAYIRMVGGLPKLWKISVSGQNNQQLTSAGIFVGGFTMTPFDLMGSYFSWSPDSSEIAFCAQKSDHYNLWTIAADGPNEKMISQNTDRQSVISSPMWSPVGNRIAYVRTKPPQSSVSITNPEQNIFQTESQLRLLGWSASGTEIFVGIKDKKEIKLLKISTASGEKPNQVAKISGAYLHGIKISPDGKQVAFTERRTGNDNIYLIPIGGGETRQLTTNRDPTIYYSGLTWAPDGTTLYYSKQTGGLQISMITNPK